MQITMVSDYTKQKTDETDKPTITVRNFKVFLKISKRFEQLQQTTWPG